MVKSQLKRKLKTIKSNDLVPFLGREAQNLHYPGNLGEFTYVSNGKIALRVPKLKDVKKEYPIKQIVSLPWDEDRKETYVPLKSVLREMGIQKLIKKMQIATLQIGERHFLFDSIYLIGKFLNGVMIATTGKYDQPCPFYFEGGEGIVLPIKINTKQA